MYLHCAIFHVHIQDTLFDSGQKQALTVCHFHLVDIIGTGLDHIFYRAQFLTCLLYTSIIWSLYSAVIRYFIL